MQKPISQNLIMFWGEKRHETDTGSSAFAVISFWGSTPVDVEYLRKESCEVLDTCRLLVDYVSLAIQDGLFPPPE